MALESLKGVKEIGGFEVYDCDDDEEENSNDTYICVDHLNNEISFVIQNGPIGENGVNGCQLLTMIQTCKIILEKLNDNYPSVYNARSIIALEACIKAQNDRTSDREKRNVEGKSEL